MGDIERFLAGAHLLELLQEYPNPGRSEKIRLREVDVDAISAIAHHRQNFFLEAVRAKTINAPVDDQFHHLGGGNLFYFHCHDKLRHHLNSRRKGWAIENESQSWACS